MQVEGVLNSRPLCPLTEDPEELEALTPGHFLIGTALNALPECPAEDSRATQVNRYKHLQLLVQQFWTKWTRNYLHSLQQRSKWQVSNVPSDLVGRMAIIHEENAPPMLWKLARVIGTHPGADGVVRVVTVKTRDGCFKRALVKISLLPVEAD